MTGQVFVYKFDFHVGGIGDFIGFFMAAHKYAEINNYTLKLYVKHPIKQYFDFNEDIYITEIPENAIVEMPPFFYDKGLKNESLNITNYINFNTYTINLFDDFKVKNNIPDVYNVVYFRLGDVKLESYDIHNNDIRLLVKKDLIRNIFFISV